MSAAIEYGRNVLPKDGVTLTLTKKKRLETQLWSVADSLRGKMNADEFRDYCLGFIFYKYLSERLETWANGILKDEGTTFTALDEMTADGSEMLEALREEALGALGYFLTPAELFHTLAERGKRDEFILDDLTKVLNNIEHSTMGSASEEDFDHLFEDLDLTSTKLGRTESAKNTLIAKIMGQLDSIDFQLEHTDSDVLGDAYEYLIGQFASGAGKKAGEFYTPSQVSTILAKIVTTGKAKLKSIYDPACGSGSLLLRVAREVDSVGDYYGQEMNRTTFNLARMNMIMHGVHYRNFNLKQEDTLEHPQHLAMRFEAVVANPPFSAHWSANPIFQSDDRFSPYGRLAPSSKADYAFVQHMLYQLGENGTMAVILPHGALSRGGAEGHIRQYLIKDQNWLDAVIGLPANIFYGTGIPTCIMVFKKCRENPEGILFIDASAHFEKAGNQNYLRDEDVEKIVSTYQERKAEDKYSYVAPLSEVEENNYNLNIPRYVNPFGDEEPINLDDVVLLLDDSRRAFEQADTIITRFCHELNIPEPKGVNVSLLEIYKRGVMQKLFSQEVRFKREDGSAFPDWEEKTLGEVLDYEQPTKYIVESTEYDDSFDTPVLTAGKTFILGYTAEDHNIYDNLPVIIFDDFTTANQYVDFPFKVKSSAMKMLKCRDPENSLKVIYEFMQMLKFPLGEHKRYWISEYQMQTLPLPSLAEQQNIAAFLSAINTKLDALSTQISQMQRFKKGLLQQMFV